MNVATGPTDRTATPTTDALGLPLPDGRVGVFAALGDFREAQTLFDRLAQLLSRIAQGPAGAVYRQELIRMATDGQVGFACPAPCGVQDVRRRGVDDTGRV